jgi:hypothetical protein
MTRKELEIANEEKPRKREREDACAWDERKELRETRLRGGPVWNAEEARRRDVFVMREW